MARAATRFVCQECGAAYQKWQGRCDACGEWNRIVEESPREAAPKSLGKGKGRRLELAALDGATAQVGRHKTGISEFDRVTGGGLVAGSALLIGGDPGIGKSTLLLQVTGQLAVAGLSCLYISGEEAIDQVRLRANRLSIDKAPLRLATATNIRDIMETIESGETDIVVIDSIQTMYVDNLDSAPGSVSQVRAAAHELIRFAKRRGATVILVGHVTKEGMIAGPRVLEHMVDAVIYFEGERGNQFRILRAVKNRFGATDEIGVFEMTDGGLLEVANPSALFLGERDETVSGTAVFAGIEGTRPLLVEIQALAAPSAFAAPRRAVVGWDNNRLAMILAVLEARCGLNLGGRDIYLNVVGGLRIAEPAADLAVAAAIISSVRDRPIPAGAVFFGEIGLSGEIRPVGHRDARIREAAKLGFTTAFTSRAPKKGRKSSAKDGIVLVELSRVADLVERLSAD